MKYQELTPGDWFYFEKKPYIKVEETDGTIYNIHLDSYTFGKVEDSIKPDDEVDFCSTLDYVYPTLPKSGTDTRILQNGVSVLGLPHAPLSRIGANELIIKYKRSSWKYAVIYGDEFTQGKVFAISNLHATDFYLYSEFYRVFPESA